MNININHTEYQKKVKSMTDAELRFIIKDASEAAQMLPDSPKAGYYQDEVNYCISELNSRKAKLPTMNPKDLMLTFFQMLNMEDNLRMEDLQVMWEALMKRNNIPLPEGWYEFIDNVNCISAIELPFFESQFNNLKF